MSKNLIDGKDRLLKTQWGRNGLLTAGDGQFIAALHKIFEHKHMGKYEFKELYKQCCAYLGYDVML